MGSIPKRRILDLRKTYSRLSLADLVNKVQAPAEAVKAAIQEMVSSISVGKLTRRSSVARCALRSTARPRS